MEIRQGNLEGNLKEISGVQVAEASPEVLRNRGNGRLKRQRAPARSQDEQATGRVRQG
jgi:hypothetical protein